jgi:hypothetical protein
MSAACTRHWPTVAAPTTDATRGLARSDSQSRDNKARAEETERVRKSRRLWCLMRGRREEMKKTAGRMGGMPGGKDASSLPRHERGTEAGKSAIKRVLPRQTYDDPLTCFNPDQICAFPLHPSRFAALCLPLPLYRQPPPVSPYSAAIWTRIRTWMCRVRITTWRWRDSLLAQWTIVLAPLRRAQLNESALRVGGRGDSGALGRHGYRARPRDGHRPAMQAGHHDACGEPCGFGRACNVWGSVGGPGESSLGRRHSLRDLSPTRKARYL